jgi:excisionase family DNA binding protein
MAPELCPGLIGRLQLPLNILSANSNAFDRSTVLTLMSIFLEPSDIATLIERRRNALTVPELAELLAISDKQVYSLIKRGSLPSYRIASSVRLDPAETADWLRSMRA